MFPIMNVAAKGMFKFLYTISSSLGSNLLKLTVGSGSREEDCFTQYFDHKVSSVQLHLFKKRLDTINPTMVQVRPHLHILINGYL